MVYRRYQAFSLGPIWVIIAVNLGMLIATTVSPRIVTTLGLVPAIFWEQPWTIVTCMFIHSGVFHLIFNMLALYFFGGYFSRLVGDKRFLIVYFGGGIFGSILYLLLGEPWSVAIGASGAIFALGGALAIMRPHLRVIIFPIFVPLPLWIAVIGGFILMSFLPSVAWQAHLGGLLVGLAVGYIFRRRERYSF
ncbi:rhomboid family intramembrane serine protease [Chloroflexota bacterium]